MPTVRRERVSRHLRLGLGRINLLHIDRGLTFPRPISESGTDHVIMPWRVRHLASRRSFPFCRARLVHHSPRQSRERETGELVHVRLPEAEAFKSALLRATMHSMKQQPSISCDHAVRNARDFMWMHTEARLYWPRAVRSNFLSSVPGLFHATM